MTIKSKVLFRTELLKALECLHPKISLHLVIEASFVPALSACIADASTLKEHGVDAFSVIDDVEGRVVDPIDPDPATRVRLGPAAPVHAPTPT